MEDKKLLQKAKKYIYQLKNSKQHFIIGGKSRQEIIEKNKEIKIREGFPFTKAYTFG